MAVYLVICSAGLYFAIRVEKHKKKHDIKTYKEISAFMEGKSLDEIEKARESGKRPYQKVLLVIGAAVVALIVCGIITLLYHVL